ncbi:hypothetical protein PO124_23005 [Bacillus licheniformis]|nr:hypothetical protein [Bacillus licheniformis]
MRDSNNTCITVCNMETSILSASIREIRSLSPRRRH